MTRTQAFEQILDERNALIRIGYTNDQAKTFRKNYKNGKMSLDKIEEILYRAGYSRVIDAVWFNFDQLKPDGKTIDSIVTEEYLWEAMRSVEHMKLAIELAQTMLANNRKRPVMDKKRR